MQPAFSVGPARDASLIPEPKPSSIPVFRGEGLQMKRVLLGVLGVIAALGVVGYLFREPLKQAMFERLTADMFVEADTDAFDPGVPVGAHLPQIAARYDGRTMTGVSEFMGANGLVLYAVRSVDW